jgi:hypothetical protein
VLAPARSFSSVVTAMLGCHPELYGFPELTLFEQATVSERLAAPPHPSPYPRSAPWNPVEGLERALAELHDGRQDDETVAAARAWLEARGDWPGAAVFDYLLGLVSPRVGVENSPGTSRRSESLERIASSFPRTRFIHLARHPVTAQRSLRAVYHLFGREMYCARAWCEYHTRIAAFCAGLPAGHVLTVRGEDVLNDSAHELARIAEWLGVRTDADAIDAMLHPERSPYARVGPQAAAGGGDGIFLRDPVPHEVDVPGSLASPDDWNIPAEMQAEIVALATALGYEEAA